MKSASSTAMNAWRRPRTTASIAKTLLFVWLFAIVASWANACLLESRADHLRGATDHVAATTTGAAHVPEADHPDDPGRAACLDLCDDEQSAVPKVATPGVPDLMATPMVATLPWSLAAVEAGFPRERPLAAAPPPQRPVAIRFLRLTI